MHIHGIDVILWNKIQTGTDPLNQPIYDEIPETVHNVLVAPASTTEILESVNLYGKKLVYTLGIPKDDTHDWIDKRITFFGRDFKSFGLPQTGIVENIPLDWNTKIQVADYE